MGQEVRERDLTVPQRILDLETGAPAEIGVDRSSRATRFCSTSCMTAVAVYVLPIEPVRKTVSALIGRMRPRSA